MNKLRSRNNTPPTDWIIPIRVLFGFANVKENADVNAKLGIDNQMMAGGKIKGWNWHDLIDNAKRFLKMFKCDVPDDLEDLIEDWLATNNPPNFAVGKIKSRFVSYDQVIKVMELMLHTWLNGAQNMVSSEIANIRAKECSDCDDNINVEECFSCHILRKMMRWWFSRYQRSTEYDKRLLVCRHCKCCNDVVVHFSDEDLRKVTCTSSANAACTESVKDMPNCWKRKILEAKHV